MLPTTLHMPDIALVAMNSAWKGLQPLYAQDKDNVCNFGDLMIRLQRANGRHGVICANPSPGFINKQALSRNQVAHLMNHALNTWFMRHGAIYQKMLVWACDAFSDLLPNLAEADRRQAIDRIAMPTSHALKIPTVQKYAPFELEKAQRTLNAYRGNDPVEFTFLLIREVGEAMQRAQHPTNMSLGQLFKR